EAYREAFLLCQVEARSSADAARELGCPTGTVQSRVARAKQMLRSRLRNSTVAGLASLTPQGHVPARLIFDVLQAAATSTEGRGAIAGGVFTLAKGITMALTNAKCLALSAAVVFGIGMASVVSQWPTSQAAPAPAEPTIEDLKRENARLRKEVAD